MVFFNCNACGEAVKKNQVEKHVMRCRNCQSLSCVDCGKDFWGNDYQNHFKCMTEEEKYYGKSYVPKALKGDAKQEQWIEKVQVALKQSSSNSSMRRLLETLQDYPNIPRKQKPFENFLRNSLNVHCSFLVSQVWNVLSSVTTQITNGQNGQKVVDETSSSGNANGNDNDGVENKTNAETDQSNGEQQLNKRERKEERRKKQHKSEKKEKSLEEDDSKENKRTKKRKRQDDHQENQVEDVDTDVSSVLVKKKKKKANADNVVPDEENLEIDDRSETPPCKKKKKTKFSWESVIIAVLKSKGEMTLKKLRKKVLNEFAAQDAFDFNEDNLKAKFNKKILKISEVKVSKERASLKIK